MRMRFREVEKHFDIDDDSKDRAMDILDDMLDKYVETFDLKSNIEKYIKNFFSVATENEIKAAVIYGHAMFKDKVGVGFPTDYEYLVLFNTWLTESIETDDEYWSCMDMLVKFHDQKFSIDRNFMKRVIEDGIDGSIII